jgi:hypothetical protein
MAIRITRIDDVDGSDSAEVVVFQLDNRAYEIDLCPRNRARFFRAIRPFMDHARLVESEEGAAITRTTVAPASQTRTDVSEHSHGTVQEGGESGDLDLIEMARRVRA